MAVTSLETKVAEFVHGPMLEAYSQLIPSTIQTAREMNRDRILDKSIRNQLVWTADALLYDAERSGEFLYVADKKQNLIFKNIEKATRQLIDTGNYVPERKDAEALKKAIKTQKIRISELELTAEGSEWGWGYFEIDTSNYKTSNKARTALTQAIYGKGKELDANMEMIKGEGLNKTRVYVLLPGYVKQKVEELRGPIVRASGLDGVDDGSWFDADDWDVGSADGGLRGVRLEAPKAPQKVEVNPYEAAYKTLLRNTDAAAKAMAPSYQAGIANILARSLKQKS